MKKVIIQIPCYNEQKTLPVVLSQLPRELDGIGEVEWLVIDDGSSDGTVQAAREHGADYIVSHSRNLGLARAFMTGLHESMKQGADIIVNIDADNQYDASCIPDLIKPILEGGAEFVIGERPIMDIEHFSYAKKLLQKLGSWSVRVASNSDVPDAPSGFRAMTREAALNLNVYNNYTYTLETLIQAGNKGIKPVSVPVRTNEDLRDSRLVSSICSYVWRSMMTILRIFVVYRAFRFFTAIGALIMFLGFIIGLRFMVFYFSGDGGGHVQSLILASILLVTGFQTIMTAFIADLISVNRAAIEELRYKLRKAEIEAAAAAKHAPGPKAGGKKAPRKQ